MNELDYYLHNKLKELSSRVHIPNDSLSEFELVELVEFAISASKFIETFEEIKDGIEALVNIASQDIDNQDASNIQVNALTIEGVGELVNRYTNVFEAISSLHDKIEVTNV